jgi:hypothetical protein
MALLSTPRFTAGASSLADALGQRLLAMQPQDRCAMVRSARGDGCAMRPPSVLHSALRA